MKKILLSLIITLLTINTALASNKVSESYDIDFPTAYELMFNNNNSIKAMIEDVKAKKYKKNSAMGEFLPKIGMNATFVHFDNDIKTEVSSINLNGSNVAIPNLTIQDKNLGVFGFNAVWNIFTGGKILALNSKARAELLGANLKYQALSSDLTTKLIQNYYGLKFALDVVEVRKNVLDTTEEHLDDAKKMEKEGLIPQSERLHAEVAYRQAKKDYETSLKDVSIIEEGLKNLIKADDIDLANVSITPHSGLFITNKELPTLEELKQEAVKNNPNFKQTEVQKRLAQANYRANVANYSPTVSLFAYDVAAQSNLATQLPRFGVGADRKSVV